MSLDLGQVLICVGLAGALIVTYFLGMEVGRSKERKDSTALRRYQHNLNLAARRTSSRPYDREVDGL